MLADRRDSQIRVQAKERFQVAESQNRLETCLRVAISLGDNISSGLTGLLLFEPSMDNQLGIEDIARRLESEKFDMEFLIAMKRMYKNEPHVNFENALEFAVAVEQVLKMALFGNRQRELEHIALSLRRVMTRLRFGKFGRTLPVHGESEFLLRKAIDPKIAVEVAVRNPQAALVFFQLAKEVHNSKWIYSFIHRFSDRAFDPCYLLKLSERDPEAALAWVQLVKEFRGVGLGERSLIKTSEMLFKRTLPHCMQELNERNPEAALAWVQLVKEFGGEHFLRGMGPAFFKRALDPRYLLDLRERNPEAALVLVQLVKEFEGESFLQGMGPAFFERALDPRYLLELIMRNPEIALAWVQLSKEFGGESFLQRMDLAFFERALDPCYLLEPTAFAVLLRLARITESPRATELVLSYLISSLHQPSKGRVSLETLPLIALSDLKWLAKTTASPEINSVLSRLLDETTSA